MTGKELGCEWHLWNWRHFWKSLRKNRLSESQKQAVKRELYRYLESCTLIVPTLPEIYHMYKIKSDGKAIWCGRTSRMDIAKTHSSSSSLRRVVRRESDGAIVWDSEQPKGSE